MRKQELKQLAQQCRKQQEVRDPQSLACLTLFDCALKGEEEQAWDILYATFYSKVEGWVYRYSRFALTGESAAYFANDAFARTWRYGRKRAKEGKFTHTGHYLEYLKRSAWSSIETYVDKLNSDGIGYAQSPEALEFLPESTPESNPLMELIWDGLSQVTANNPDDQLLAEELFVYGWTPRQIVSRYPDRFPTTKMIDGRRTNIIKRLKRWCDKQAAQNA